MNDEKKAVVIGAVAGWVPSMINLIHLAPDEMFTNFDMATFLGNVVKILLLMFLGGLIVFLNKEINVLKAFQLGIAAPAIFIGFINGTALNTSEEEVKLLTDPAEIGAMENVQRSSLSFFISSAYAADVKKEKTYLRKAPITKRFWYGLTGSIQNPWFVIAGSHKSKKTASKHAEALKKKGYDAKVFNRFAGRDYYGVMIGSYLSLKEARQLRLRAIQDGLPKDTYLWKWR
jgi:hypothetical protein